VHAHRRGYPGTVAFTSQEDTLHLTIQEKDNTIQMLRREIERQQSGGATGGASE
jgi:hypothetical protein